MIAASFSPVLRAIQLKSELRGGLILTSELCLKDILSSLLCVMNGALGINNGHKQWQVSF